MRVRPIQWECAPSEMLSIWPRDRALLALLSSGEHPQHARWSIFAMPEHEVSGADHVEVLRHVTEATRAEREPKTWEELGADLPFVGGYVGQIAYEYGAVLEPRVGKAWDAEPAHMRWWRCERALVCDHQEGRWWEVGPQGWSEAWRSEVGGERGRTPSPTSGGVSRSASRGFEINGIDAECSRERYLAGVERVLEYIRAGDVYQVNLTHMLHGTFRGSTRRLYQELARRAGAWYGAYLEHARGVEREVLCSVSPELFVSFDARTRRVTTRPMKGTFRADDPVQQAEAEGAKARAELAMIIDLMRNDLGRVCEIGSIRVDRARELERHGAPEGSPSALWQGTGTVSGRLPPGVGIDALFRACFPGGSVTGAPKLRAMQIIREFESGPRGMYCGCAGFISDHGRAGFNLAIRTAVVRGRANHGDAPDTVREGRIEYGVGAGIVSDSVAEREWEETVDKAAVLLDVVGRRRARKVPEEKPA